MPATPMAVAKCVLPVPGPPTSSALCASSVKAVVARVATRLRSTGETSKSKPARSRCTGNFATCIWWLTERIARSAASACSRCSMSQREDSMPALPPCSTRSAQAPAVPCWRSDLDSTSTSGFRAGRHVGVVTVGGTIATQTVIACGVGSAVAPGLLELQQHPTGGAGKNRSTNPAVGFCSLPRRGTGAASRSLPANHRSGASRPRCGSCLVRPRGCTHRDAATARPRQTARERREGTPSQVTDRPGPPSRRLARHLLVIT